MLLKSKGEESENDELGDLLDDEDVDQLLNDVLKQNKHLLFLDDNYDLH